MNLLLDTHVFLWWIDDDPIPWPAAEAIRIPENTVWLSAASAWEITIKASIGKLRLPDRAARFVESQRQRNAFRRLPEIEIPGCGGCSFAFQARQPAQSELCNGWCNTEGGRTDPQAGISIDRNRLSWLPVNVAALDILQDLPFHHRDPFDRMLIAQAISSGFTLVSADSVFDHYPVKKLWS